MESLWFARIAHISFSLPYINSSKQKKNPLLAKIIYSYSQNAIATSPHTSLLRDRTNYIIAIVILGVSPRQKLPSPSELVLHQRRVSPDVTQISRRITMRLTAASREDATRRNAVVSVRDRRSYGKETRSVARGPTTATSNGKTSISRRRWSRRRLSPPRRQFTRAYVLTGFYERSSPGSLQSSSEKRTNHARAYEY